MALTKISTDGVQDEAITKSKIPANQIEASELADNSVDSAALSADCVIGSKIADSQIATEHIVNEAVTLSKLEHGTSSNDGKFLRANNGADPSYETITLPTIQNPSTFTGNNSTTAFTINSGHTVNTILVVYNGVILTPTTDYTVSGTTMTMQFTPPTNAQIVVRYLPI